MMSKCPALKKYVRPGMMRSNMFANFFVSSPDSILCVCWRSITPRQSADLLLSWYSRVCLGVSARRTYSEVADFPSFESLREMRLYPDAEGGQFRGCSVLYQSRLPQGTHS